MDAPEPGIYYDIDEAVYRSWPLVCQSDLSLFRDQDLCEEEIKYALENPKAPSDEMQLGTMLERAVDGLPIRPDVQQLPPEIKARRGAAWLEFQRQHPGVEFLPPGEFARVQEQIDMAKAMAGKVHAHPHFEKLIAGAARQVSLVADLKFIGAGGAEVTHRVKCRLDYWKESSRTISDLKSSRHGSQKRVGGAAWDYAFDIQSAVYTDAMQSLIGESVRFYFIVCRTIRPHVVTVYNGHNSTEMAGHYLAMGRSAYQIYLEQLAECRETGVWRGYYSPDAPDSKVLDMYIPSWAV